MQRSSQVLAGVIVLFAGLVLAGKGHSGKAPRAARARTDAPAAAPGNAAAPESGQSLRAARRGFATRISLPATAPTPLPTPPAELFVRSDFAGGQGRVLAAYVTPAPTDGRKHPAIIWLTGGETNTLDNFWTPGPESNDQSASAFRQAGVVMMFPTLRGGNTNGGGREYFPGEVDDVLAAAEHLAAQSYVDPQEIYLGGHSTGGTLALLTAETSGRFKGVFAFGPVAHVDRYPTSLIPVDFGERNGPERRLRSPIYWLPGITSPTYLIEGRSPPSNAEDVEELCAADHNPQVHCILAKDANHFSVLSRVSRVIAARLSVASDIPFVLRADEFDR
jgi:acetyl esterase/lipase